MIVQQMHLDQLENFFGLKVFLLGQSRRGGGGVGVDLYRPLVSTDLIAHLVSHHVPPVRLPPQPKTSSAMFGVMLVNVSANNPAFETIPGSSLRYHGESPAKGKVSRTVWAAATALSKRGIMSPM